MGRKVIVTIVSDQSVPNVLFIKEFVNTDKFIFISTNKMESPYKQMSAKIISAAGIDSNNCQIIEVIEDSLLDIDSKLSDRLEIEDDDEVLVNITGGTKIMSLGVYNYFSRNGAADIFYIPIGKNEIRQVFPLRKNRIKELKFRINLLDYLLSYGVKVQKESFATKNLLLKPIDQTKKLFSGFISDRNFLFSNAESIRLNNYRGKKINSKKEEDKIFYENAMAFTKYGVQFERPDEVNKKETKYLTGEWLEEFIYPIIKDTLKVKDEEIGMGIQLLKNETPNEYDIIFTHNNSLYVIECKTDVSDNEEGKINYLFTNTLYKAATLKKEFGLWVNYYLFALNDFSTLSDVQKKRATLLDIKLVGLETLSNEKKLIEYISKM